MPEKSLEAVATEVAAGGKIESIIFRSCLLEVGPVDEEGDPIDTPISAEEIESGYLRY